MNNAFYKGYINFGIRLVFHLYSTFMERLNQLPKSDRQNFKDATGGGMKR